MEKKITVGNVCFIFDKKREKVLLLLRNKDPMKNMVTGVGGKTEFQEDIHLSCHREVFEETGIKPTNVCLKGVLKTIVDGGVYSSKLKNREFANAESHIFDFEKTGSTLDIGAVFSESKMGLSAKEKTDSSACVGMSSWILFVYTAQASEGLVRDCDEGRLVVCQACLCGLEAWIFL
jgi:8-oxo-dGTP pyrophosphatase MutT (NUDIX family)